MTVPAVAQDWNLSVLRRKVFDGISIGGLSECWEWQGRHNHQGYSEIYEVATKKSLRLHRVVWTLWRRPIPPGQTIDHLCRNRGCVNPRHLEVVSGKENTLRGDGPSARHARQTHCKHGHEFTPENTYVDPKAGGRSCRVCRKRRKSEWKARQSV